MVSLSLPSPDRFAIADKIGPPEERAELVVIGAGAAGCAAAIEAARAGAGVLLVDEHPVASGLIGMDVPYHFGGRATAAVQNPERLLEQVLESNPALAEAVELGVDVRLSTCAWGAWVNGPGLQSTTPIVGLADETRSWLVGFDWLILATGARDLTLSFSGSEQPGVMGTQALQALLARYDAFAGRRLVILGTGALALDTAALALDRGLDVAALVEVRAEPQGRSDRLAALRDRGVEIVTSHVPLTAQGGADGVTALVLVGADDPSRRREIACDTVCGAVGTVPAIELLDVLGAERTFVPARGGHVPVAASDGATSLPQVFVAGDCAGLGADAAAGGRAAAWAALRSIGRVVEPSSAPPPSATGPVTLDYPLDWARALLATGGTDVLACLCEEVTRGELMGVQPPRYLGWSSAAMSARSLATLSADGPLDQDQMKRLTRVCMGACQARRCREQVAMLMALGAEVPVETIPLAGYRAPVRPLPLSVLADARERPEMTEGWNVWFGISTQWIPYDDIGTEREAEQLRAGMPY